MSRHLDAYELSRYRSGAKSNLFDLEYIEEHANSCRLCRERLSLPKAGDMVKMEENASSVLPTEGKTAGGIYLPLFNRAIHRVPDGWEPVVAFTDPYIDGDTGLQMVDIANLHNTTSMEGSGDILLEEEEGRFWGYHMALWSRRSVLLSAIDVNKPLGMLTASTLRIADKLEKGESLSEEEYDRVGIGEPYDIGDPLYQYRERLLLDFQTLSGDLFSRSAMVLEHAGMFAERLGQKVFNEETGLFIGYGAICRKFVERYAHEREIPLQKEAFVRESLLDNDEFKEILAMCERESQGLGLLVAASYYCHLYIQTGLPVIREKAWKLIESVFPEERLSLSSLSFFLITRVFQNLKELGTTQGELLQVPERGSGELKGIQTRFVISDKPIPALLEDFENGDEDGTGLEWNFMDCIGHDRPIEKNIEHKVTWRWQIDSKYVKPELSDGYTAVVLDLDSGAFLGEADIELQGNSFLFVLEKFSHATLPEKPVWDPSRCCILIGKKYG